MLSGCARECQSEVWSYCKHALAEANTMARASRAVVYTGSFQLSFKPSDTCKSGPGVTTWHTKGRIVGHRTSNGLSIHAAPYTACMYMQGKNGQMSIQHDHHGMNSCRPASATDNMQNSKSGRSNSLPDYYSKYMSKSDSCQFCCG